MDTTICDICKLPKDVVLVCPQGENICLNCVQDKNICDWEDDTKMCFNKCYSKINS